MTLNLFSISNKMIEINDGLKISFCVHTFEMLFQRQSIVAQTFLFVIYTKMSFRIAICCSQLLFRKMYLHTFIFNIIVQY